MFDGQVAVGNAEQDGHRFDHWFIGDIERWCRQKELPFNPEAYGLKVTDSVELKWGIHQKGECRSGQWYSKAGRISLSILISGEFVIRFRMAGGDGRILATQLKRTGDYVIWREELEHTWEALIDSVVLTVRWQA